MEYAFYKKIISENFFAGPFGVKRPASFKKDKKVDPLTRDEQVKLENQLNKSKTRTDTILNIALNTGMRIGEILALRLEDIKQDMDDIFINVNKTLTRDVDKNIIVGPPKTEKGNRKIYDYFKNNDFEKYEQYVNGIREKYNSKNTDDKMVK